MSNYDVIDQLSKQMNAQMINEEDEKLHHDIGELVKFRFVGPTIEEILKDGWANKQGAEMEKRAVVDAENTMSLKEANLRHEKEAASTVDQLDDDVTKRLAEKVQEETKKGC